MAIDPEILELLCIMDECGGRIARSSYGMTHTLLKQGLAKRDGWDSLGRAMICLTDQGRELLPPPSAASTPSETESPNNPIPDPPF